MSAIMLLSRTHASLRATNRNRWYLRFVESREIESAFAINWQITEKSPTPWNSTERNCLLRRRVTGTLHIKHTTADIHSDLASNNDLTGESLATITSFTVRETSPCRYQRITCLLSRDFVCSLQPPCSSLQWYRDFLLVGPSWFFHPVSIVYGEFAID